MKIKVRIRELYLYVRDVLVRDDIYPKKSAFVQDSGFIQVLLLLEKSGTLKRLFNGT